MSSVRRARTPGLAALPLLGGLLLAGACGPGEEAARPGSPDAAPSEGVDALPMVELEGVVATPEDWRILGRTVRWARAQGLDRVPMGTAVARIGLSFVGTPYIPKTLEVAGPERTVVNLRSLDCVTFVESVLATTHVVRSSHVDGDDLDGLARAYADVLRRLRYRDGVRDGYASRLHYFSEWIRDGEAKGLLREVTQALGSTADAEPLDFMSSHPDAYRQLADPGVLERIRAVEKRLSLSPRQYVPEARIAEVSAGIRSGDVIAATSTVAGLDVAHTGIALWRDGALHLLHAPLVGDSVHVSPHPLAHRIAERDSQDGIMVARPLGPSPAAAEMD